MLEKLVKYLIKKNMEKTVKQDNENQVKNIEKEDKLILEAYKIQMKILKKINKVFPNLRYALEVEVRKTDENKKLRASIHELNRVARSTESAFSGKVINWKALMGRQVQAVDIVDVDNNNHLIFNSNLRLFTPYINLYGLINNKLTFADKKIKDQFLFFELDNSIRKSETIKTKDENIDYLEIKVGNKVSFISEKALLNIKVIDENNNRLSAYDYARKTNLLSNNGLKDEIHQLHSKLKETENKPKFIFNKLFPYKTDINILSTKVWAAKEAFTRYLHREADSLLQNNKSIINIEEKTTQIAKAFRIVGTMNKFKFIDRCGENIVDMGRLNLSESLEKTLIGSSVGVYDMAEERFRGGRRRGEIMRCGVLTNEDLFVNYLEGLLVIFQKLIDNENYERYEIENKGFVYIKKSIKSSNFNISLPKGYFGDAQLGRELVMLREINGFASSMRVVEEAVAVEDTFRRVTSDGHLGMTFTLLADSGIVYRQIELIDNNKKLEDILIYDFEWSKESNGGIKIENLIKKELNEGITISIPNRIEETRSKFIKNPKFMEDIYILENFDNIKDMGKGILLTKKFFSSLYVLKDNTGYSFLDLLDTDDENIRSRFDINSIQDKLNMFIGGDTEQRDSQQITESKDKIKDFLENLF